MHVRPPVRVFANYIFKITIHSCGISVAPRDNVSASALPQIMMVVKQPCDGRTEAEQQNQRSARKEGVDIYFFFSPFLFK